LSEETILDLVNSAEITADDLHAVSRETEALPKPAKASREACLL
jgi:hypothetical protein